MQPKASTVKQPFLYRFVVVLLTGFVAGCVAIPRLAPPSGEKAPPTAASQPAGQVAVAATAAPSPSATKAVATLTALPSATQSVPTATPTPTATAAPSPTPTPIPQPVFDTAQLGDLRKLAGFAISSRSYAQKGTAPGGKEGVRIHQSELKVNTNPWQAYLMVNFEETGIAGQEARKYTDTYYWLGHTIYHYSLEAHYWFLEPDTKEGAQSNFESVINPAVMFSAFKDVRFVGQEDYRGIKASHFALGDGVKVQWNFLVSADGNYLLHADGAATGNNWRDSTQEGQSPASLGIYQFLLEVSGLNQAQTIDLPPQEVMQVPLELDVPLPAGAILDHIGVGRNSPPDYTYNLPLSGDEAMAFYRALQPTNGWSVRDVGAMGELGIVNLQKGGQVLLTHLSWKAGQSTTSMSFSYTPPP